MHARTEVWLQLSKHLQACTAGREKQGASPADPGTPCSCPADIIYHYTRPEGEPQGAPARVLAFVEVHSRVPAKECCRD